MHRLNKKIVLLCSPNAPFWHTTLEKVTRAIIAQTLGFSQTTLLKWEMGGEVRDSSIEKMFNNVRQKAITNRFSEEEKEIKNDKIDKIMRAIQDDEIGVYDFGAILGFSHTDCQRAVDTEIFKKYPVFKGLYYDDTPGKLGELDEDFDAYQGCYRVYVQRSHRILQGALRVRYPIKVQSLWTIRVKMNLPRYVNALGTQKGYFEYDGFLSVKSGALFWMMEERRSRDADFFQMITERPDMQEGYRAARGHHLTTRRTKDNEIVTGEVALEQIDLKDQKIIDFMHNSSKIVNDEDFSEIWERISTPPSKEN